MYKPHFICRACNFGTRGPGGIKSGPPENLVKVFSLGVQPLANDFCNDIEERGGFAPLEVLLCPRCSLAQLSVTVDPAILYAKYNYVTSPGATMQLHLLKVARDIYEAGGTDSMVEIGSNDGAALELFARNGFPNVCGIEPAANLIEIARGRGVPTITGLFCSPTATDARATLGRVNVVLARHVFCHIDNWHVFFDDLNALSHPETLACIEVPYAYDLLRKVEFDTIYHEHTSYLTIRAILAALKDTQWNLHRIFSYEIHGGALMLMLSRKDSIRQQDPSVENFAEAESHNPIELWQQFAVTARQRIDTLGAYVRGLRQNNMRVAGLGASAKSTVWVNACQFTRKEIEWIADSTPQKQYKTSPGSDIPVVDEGAILRDLPDYVLCFAWNFREEILRKNKMARDKGVKFIFPVPEIETV